ncbi:MAG: B12-binding domain-containing radical SAM protein [Candidatus Kuenenia stuttgartiensis]|nr:MAG: B12-binding domain-containing radical SAM protein [Candidatus Kuenenia stuttgartiensis]
MHEEYVKRLKNLDDVVWQEVKRVLSDFNPDVLGVSSMTASYVSALNVSIIAKQINPKVVIVFGGKHPTALPKNTLKNKSIDYVVIGEGEETFRELLLHLGKPENVQGIAYRNSRGEVLVTPQRPYIADINKLPIPIFESSINRYDFENKNTSGAYTWSIISARGCPFQCIYCSSDKIIRYRSIESVTEEINFVKQKFGINQFCFEDDSFSMQRTRALELCNRLKCENIKWQCNTRVDLIDKDVVSAMKRSGCVEVAIGIETGSLKTLERIRKKINYEKVSQAIKLFKKSGILVKAYFMIGFPWENREDMEQTLKLIHILPIDDFQLNIATPLPGTQMFQELVDSGKINPDCEDWSRYQQGSFYMNFSQYSDAEWEKMLFEFIDNAYKLYKKRLFWKILKMLLRDPIKIITKIKSKLIMGKKDLKILFK